MAYGRAGSVWCRGHGAPASLSLARQMPSWLCIRGSLCLRRRIGSPGAVINRTAAAITTPSLAVCRTPSETSSVVDEHLSHLVGRNLGSPGRDTFGTAIDECVENLTAAIAVDSGRRRAVYVHASAALRRHSPPHASPLAHLLFPTHADEEIVHRR
jgi:hypothetical protein